MKLPHTIDRSTTSQTSLVPRRVLWRPIRLAAILTVASLMLVGSFHSFAQDVSVSGDVTPGGATSPTWNVGGDLKVGDTGIGTLQISGTGLVSNTAGQIGHDAGSSGFATVSSGTWNNSSFLHVGFDGSGTLLVDGGLVSNSFGRIGESAGSFGSATVSSGTWASSDNFVVGYSGTGTLLVDGGLVSNAFGNIGESAGSFGSATVSSGTWANSGVLTVGDSGTGTLLINGGLVSNSLLGIIGNLAESTGSTTVSSGTWANSGALIVARSGTGTLLVDGGLVSNSFGTIGEFAGSSGSATVTSGTWANSESISLGGSGTGTLLINGGLVSNTTGRIADNVGGSGSATVSSGTWANSGDLLVGRVGTGTLLINGGLVSVSGTSTAGSFASGVGTITLSGSGILSTQRLMEGNGSGTVTFDGGILQAQTNHNNFISDFEAGDVTINAGGAYIDSNGFEISTSTQLSGAGALTKLGTGTLILRGSNSYLGDTDVEGGTLVVNGSHSGTGTTTVDAGATLGGSGTLSGPVVVNDNGHLAPGTSPGTLSTGDLTLNSLSQLDFELDTPNVVGGGVNDLISVTGDLILDGILNITNLGNFGDGSYRLFDYTGSLTDNGLLFGIVPAPFDLTLDTGTANQINLNVVAATAQYWDGMNTSPNGVVDGGSGTWDNSETNWTNMAGNANAAWADLTAIFSGSTGTVNVTEAVAIAGTKFATDGYLLSGTGSLVVNGVDSVMQVDPAVAAEIAVAITGTGGLLKNGSGELTLSGTNTHSGGTKVTDGKLITTNNRALGSGSAFVTGSNAILQLDADLFAAPLNNEITAANGGTVDNSTNIIRAGNGVTLEAGGILINQSGATIGGSSIGVSGTGGAVKITNSGAIQNSIGLDDFANEVILDQGSVVGGFLDMGSSAAATLTLTGTGSQLYSSAVAGTTTFSGTLIKEQAGTWTVNRDLGATAVALNDGILRIGDGGTNGSISGGVNIAAPGTLIFDRSDARVFSHPLSGSGAFEHVGTGTTTLSSASPGFSGASTIRNGTLRTTAMNALGTGPVTLDAGTLDPVGTLNTGAFDWNGGTIASDLGTMTDFIDVNGNLTLAGPGTFDFAAVAGFSNNTAYKVFNADNMAGFDPLADFTGNALFTLAPVFSIVGEDLFVNFMGSPIFTGAILQNSAPVNVPTFADFIVNGRVTTGTPTESNIINSLIFNPASSLYIFNTLTVTSGRFTVDGGTGTIDGGGIVVPGDFLKDGAGDLVLNNAINIAGAASVQAGALFVNGNFSTGGGLTVFQNALLGGSGVINGNVANNGTVNPGNSPGTLTINGNYTQSSSGTLQIEIASASVFDRLVVSGNAALAGTLQALNYGGNKLKYGQQFAFLQAGSITGDFDRILMPDPDRFRGRFLAEGGTGTLLVAPTSYTLVAETTNQRNVAKALDSYIPERGNDRETVSIALDLQSEEQYPAAFDAIAPTFYESLADITIDQTVAQNQMLAQRMSAVRLGARGFSAVGIESPLRYDRDGKSVMEPKDYVKPVVNPNPRWSTWVQGNGIFAKMVSASQVPNYHFQSGGFLVGADYRWSENFSTGLYTGYEYTWADYDGGGNTQINSALFGGYATYDNEGFYADAIIGGGYNGYRVRRPVEFSTVDRTARSTPNGGQFSSYLDFGYDWKVNGFTFGPLVSAQYTYAGIAPFTEDGADSLDLRVDQQNANSIRTNLGARIAYTWNVCDTVTIIPELRAFWQHEFLENPRNIGASLDGGNGPSFGYETTTPDRDSIFAGAGVSAQFGQNWSASLYYNANFASQDFLSHAISASLEWKF